MRRRGRHDDACGRLEVIRNPDGTPDFRFHANDRDDQWGNADQAQRVYTGARTVPFEGAVPPFLSRDNG